MKKARTNFIDITPTIATDNGNVYRLGTVRYEVPEELIGELHGNKTVYYTNSPIVLYGVESHRMTQLSFHVETSTDAVPQPKSPYSVLDKQVLRDE